jgi:hypothetical protein
MKCPPNHFNDGPRLACILFPPSLFCFVCRIGLLYTTALQNLIYNDSCNQPAGVRVKDRNGCYARSSSRAG